MHSSASKCVLSLVLVGKPAGALFEHVQGMTGSRRADISLSLAAPWVTRVDIEKDDDLCLESLESTDRRVQ